jgi:hypothetical protein
VRFKRTGRFSRCTRKSIWQARLICGGSGSTHLKVLAFKDLHADDFKTRERTTVELERLAELVENQVRAALKDETSAETKRRLERILDAIDLLDSGRLRQLRAVQLLGRIGTAEARSLLQELCYGAAAGRLTCEAKASVQRRWPTMP